MLVKAFLTRKDNPSVIVPFLFNPKELSVEKSNQFAEVNIPGLPSPILQFVRGNARSVTMDLFFDTYEQGADVRTFTDQITGWDAGSMFSRLPGAAKGLMDIDSDLHAPPVCLFIWGAFMFQCIIERVSKRFTMFLPEGIPVRATLSVTLKEYREVDVQVKEISLQSADLTKRWVVTQGDSLWSIAAKEYGNPGDWRLIAEANKIDNPRILTPGEELVVPFKE
ncbi:MAG TPA: LysM peptidoglycan-binding domain-containing protein [Thermodesulfobacteriota bacterium]|nr:LysM peptidoglycan-binding domain-containing protein [Thermodesulfobacteriota bacterium]